MGFTRQEYLARECTHREYYAQYVTDSLVDYVGRVADLKTAYRQDEHLNSIPLGIWDNIARAVWKNERIARQLRDNGDYPSIAGAVCILKEAARQNIERG